MTDKNPNTIHLSASAINALKACPTRFRLAYREGLRLEESTEAQRVGTHWHAMHEVYHEAYREERTRLVAELDAGHGGDDMIPERCHEDAYGAAIEHLNQCYSEVPSWIEPVDWDVERLILLTSFHVYLWYYEDDPIESYGEEVRFNLPLHEPRTGMPLPLTEVVRVGTIDTLIKWGGMIGNREMKSTARNIGIDSDYWDRSKKDTQVSMYALALQDLHASGQLPANVLAEVETAHSFGNTMYDV